MKSSIIHRVLRSSQLIVGRKKRLSKVPIALIIVIAALVAVSLISIREFQATPRLFGTTELVLESHNGRLGQFSEQPMRISVAIRNPSTSVITVIGGDFLCNAQECFSPVTTLPAHIEPGLTLEYIFEYRRGEPGAFVTKHVIHTSTYQQLIVNMSGEFCF